MQVEGDTLFLFIENSMAVAPVVEGGQILSTKMKRQEHGYGLRNMQDAVRRMGGEMLPEWDEERFVVSCSLPIKGDGSDGGF
jgi:signal transduction histidine kinase